jgi:hypothetical protein
LPGSRSWVRWKNRVKLTSDEQLDHATITTFFIFILNLNLHKRMERVRRVRLLLGAKIFDSVAERAARFISIRLRRIISLQKDSVLDALSVNPPQLIVAAGSIEKFSKIVAISNDIKL